MHEFFLLGEDGSILILNLVNKYKRDLLYFIIKSSLGGGQEKILIAFILTKQWTNFVHYI